MGFKCGIVGLPNVGKSTLFNTLAQMDIPAENYPFCTIKPNTGTVLVPDKRLDAIAEIAKPKKIVPTTIEFVDIAGLVAGASKGEGMGNQFLAHIREVDAIAHVVRCFDDENVTHVSGSLDPIADADTINIELVLADLDTVGRAITKAKLGLKSGADRAAKLHLNLLERVEKHLSDWGPARSMQLDITELNALRPLCLLTIKPTLYVANIGEEGLVGNSYATALEQLAHNEEAGMVALSAKFEAELADMDEGEQEIFLMEMGLDEPGLNRFIRAGYDLLSLSTYFTAGPKEVRAWTVPANTCAPDAAGVIHTDFIRGFIRAEVISYEHYIGLKGEQGAKEAGKLRVEGKDYIVQDGDVMHFLFNV